MSSHPQGAEMMPKGPPYPPTTWSLGGVAREHVDIPISAVFLFLFICCAAAHMTILQLNQRRGHKFLLSGLLFGFSMARIATLVLRIASTTRPHNIKLAIAAGVFLNAGVVILFIVNLIFTQRLVRASHPAFGWSKGPSIFFLALYALVIATIAMVIVAVVQPFLTLNEHIRHIDRSIQLYGVTCFAVLAFLPTIITLINISIRRQRDTRMDKFGEGRFRTKVAVVITASLLLTFGAAYRAGGIWIKPVPRTEPIPRVFHKAALYVVYFTVEFIVLAMFAIVRVDQRFHVPNGAKGPGSYRNNVHAAGGNAWNERDIEDGIARPPMGGVYSAGSDGTGLSKAAHDELAASGGRDVDVNGHRGLHHDGLNRLPSPATA